MFSQDLIVPIVLLTAASKQCIYTTRSRGTKLMCLARPGFSPSRSQGPSSPHQLDRVMSLSGFESINHVTNSHCGFQSLPQKGIGLYPYLNHIFLLIASTDQVSAAGPLAWWLNQHAWAP